MAQDKRHPIGDPYGVRVKHRNQGPKASGQVGTSNSPKSTGHKRKVRRLSTSPVGPLTVTLEEYLKEKP